MRERQRKVNASERCYVDTQLNNDILAVVTLPNPGAPVKVNRQPEPKWWDSVEKVPRHEADAWALEHCKVSVSFVHIHI